MGFVAGHGQLPGPDPVRRATRRSLRRDIPPARLRRAGMAPALRVGREPRTLGRPGGRPTAGRLRDARADDRRRLGGLEAGSNDVFRPRPERPLLPVPEPAAPDADLVDAAVARLEQAPRALEQARANLDPKLASPLIVERGIGSARAGGQYVRSMLVDEAETDPAARRPAGRRRDRRRRVRRVRRVPRRATAPMRGHVGLRRGALLTPAAGTRSAQFRRSIAARDGPGGVRPARR